MNTISGRVVLKESGVGIPDVLVVLTDLDPGTSPEDVTNERERAEAARSNIVSGDRIGSVLTDRNGAFSLSFGDTEFQVRNPSEKRPDVQLSVLAPEGPDEDPETRVLYMSTAVRPNAGMTEQYLVRLSAERLKAAGITPPSATDTPSSTNVEPATHVVSRLADDETRFGDIVTGAMDVAKQRTDAHRTRFSGFRERLKPALLEELSRVPRAYIGDDRHVGPGDSPFDKCIAAIRKTIRETINSDDPAKRPTTDGRLTLTEAELEQLRSLAGPDGSVPASAVAAVAAGNGTKATTTFVQARERGRLCLPESAQHQCARSLLEGDDAPPEPPTVTGNGAVEVTEEDVPRYLARLLEPLTAPEEQLLTGLMPVATRDSVQATVANLSFPPSPADVPAFHDFTSLHIAFDTVWQELVDRGVIDLAEDVYDTVLELGGDPVRDDLSFDGPIAALVEEGRTTTKAARIVRDHRTGQGDGSASGAQGGVVVTGGSGGRGGGRWPARPPASTSRCSGTSEPIIRDHRRGAVRIGAPRWPGGSPAERLPDLLEELERRLRRAYAFTVFAANGKERSVNFGILNTYRQVWTPLSYQAGPLVKSIPLAPRQTQKVVISRKTTRKRSHKEIENNLRVLKDEMSTTTRAEQDIIRRAQSKNDFSAEHVDKGGAEPAASHTTTVKFGHEASKSSDDIKKSFREATFKSAQEVRQERNVEILTEETEETEYTETTEISNPNDEIAVTFLFYELQRRYRIRERLHRVTPVVLVAQEFPQPHDISPAWLVAHDWILKRVILDDSFLPTLNSLSESAGNETALAEMKLNVEQQRCIVEELREEVASARRRATLQQALVERGVFQKAGVVDDRGGSSVLGIVGDALESAVGAVAGAATSVADTVGDFIFGGDDAGQSQANRQAMEERAREAADQARELMFRLEREVTALNALTETYAKALKQHHTLLTEIARLEGHVRDNIMYYMQKIWSHEPPDQRYFRLHNVPVPVFSTTERVFDIDFDEPMEAMAEVHATLPRFGGAARTALRCGTRTKVDDNVTFAPLAEVADLDRLLGYKGNYMIFPLHRSNAVTDLLMDPYIDRATGELVDPSDPSSWSIDEFADYVCCLKDQLTEQELAEVLPQLREQYAAILSAGSRADDVLVVPTNSLFIEALPASHEVLGNFKRAHRVIDVKMAQADHRGRELENVRRAARLLAGELEDPDIDKKIVVDGSSTIVVPPEA